jgi:hypothetical protein
MKNSVVYVIAQMAGISLLPMAIAVLTRALYGTNTAFRIEAGDLPEFAFYMPGMGGNLKFGLINNQGSKWLIEAKNIVARYRPGSMHYHITDPMLGNGYLEMSILALSKGEGLVLKTRFKNVKKGVQLFWAFGGASGKNFSRSGDMGPDPESSFYLKAENCFGNIFTYQNNSFSLTYGKDKTLTGIFPSNALKIGDATNQASPITLDHSKGIDYPVLTGKLKIANEQDYYWLIQKSASRYLA